MAATNFTPIQLYNSSTAAATPLAANLANGELAINIADGKLYYKDSGGVVQLLASSSGASGNVVGPASSTDNAISRFDGTTGKLIQNSVVTIADTTGNMAGVGTLGVGAITTSGALVGAVSQDAFNTVSTTLNLGGAATTVNIGAATGTLTVANATLAAKALTATAITNSALTATRLVYSGTAGLEVDSANLTFNGTDLTVSGAVNAGSINATTLDLTNLEVTNIKAKDGTASIDLADTTGIATFSKATVISTTDNTNAALRITQLGTGNALLVEDETNPDSTPFVIDASGIVIVGSTAALTNGVVQTFKLDGIASNDLIRKNTAGSGVVLSGDTVGNLRFYGFDGTNYTRTAHIFSAVDGTPGVNDMPGRLVFGTTADGASSPTERMRIDNAGRVGIAAIPATGASFTVGNTADTTATIYGIRDLTTVNQATTTDAFGVSSQTNILTPAALTSLSRFYAAQGSFTGTLTNQYGFNAIGLTGATNNFGFYSNIAAAANRWNFYANGTARNYMAADLTVNGATAIPAGGTAGAGLMVSTTANFGVFFGSGAPTLSAAKGSLYLRSDGSTVNDRMYVNTNGSTTWTSVVTSA